MRGKNGPSVVAFEKMLSFAKLHFLVKMSELLGVNVNEVLM